MLIFKTNNKRIKLSSPDRRSVSNKEVKSSLQSLTLPSGAEIWYPLSVLFYISEGPYYRGFSLKQMSENFVGT